MCQSNVRLTQSQFIDRVSTTEFPFTEGELDFSKSEYKNSTTKVLVSCSIHGEFWITPKSLFKGCGCWKCANKYRGPKMSFDEFVKRSNIVHNYKFKYIKESYIGAAKKVEYICENHGKISQLGAHHLRGHGCPKCSIIEYSKTRMMSDDEFVERMNSITSDGITCITKSYPGNKGQVVFECSIHGKFSIKAHAALYRSSNQRLCYKCERSGRALTNDDFLERANEAHNFKYQYPEEYKGAHTKIPIICPVHGEFVMKPTKHINTKQGCPKCNMSQGESMIMRVFSRLQIEFDHQKRFEGCRLRKPLPFDFYLPTIGACIEYQGIQHFQTVDDNFFGGEKALKARQKRDQIKRDYCQKNRIPLLEIRYDDPDPEATLRKFLSQHSGRKFIDPQLKLFPV